MKSWASVEQICLCFLTSGRDLICWGERVNRSLPTSSTSPTVHVFGSLLQKKKRLCQIPNTLLAQRGTHLQLKSGCQQNENETALSHPSMLFSVSKADICLKVSEGKQYCFNSSNRSFRASRSMRANTSLSRKGKRGPSISMKPPVRLSSEMPC